ncbi:MAG TPA: Uma2 family endonuclease [Pseudonocardiaceae bacterium]|nr:Uma2 family endonuclease [Pseudonocardiaceae bacterium]
MDRGGIPRTSSEPAGRATGRGSACEPKRTDQPSALSSRLWAALDAAIPFGLEVLEAINVRVGPGKILIPDLAVVTVPGVDLTVCEAADVVLVVEIASPGNAAVDRAVKPQLYAQAGVPHYLRIELTETGPRALVYQLKRDHYVEVAKADPGQPLVLTEPIAATLDLAALAATTRPPG